MAKAMGGWVIRNLRDPSKKSGHTGKYITVVPEEAVKQLGGMKNTEKAIAAVGNWDVQTIHIRHGDPSVWEKEAKHVFIAERDAE